MINVTFTVPPMSPALALILRMHGLEHNDVPQEKIEDLERQVAEKLKEAE